MTHCRQMMLEELQRRNYRRRPSRSYLHAVERFARHFNVGLTSSINAHPNVPGVPVAERQLQPQTVWLHVAALRFFFVKTLRRRYLIDDTPYPKAPQRLP